MFFTLVASIKSNLGKLEDMVRQPPPPPLALADGRICSAAQVHGKHATHAPREELSLTELFDSSLSNTVEASKEQGFKDESLTRVGEIQGLAKEVQGQLKQLAADAQDQGKGYSAAERQMRTNMHRTLGKRTVRVDPCMHAPAYAHCVASCPSRPDAVGWLAGCSGERVH